MNGATKWIPNEQANECALCDKPFNPLVRRKHHCRSCGALVCSKCSPDKGYVPGYKDVKVRICTRCQEARGKRAKEIEGRVFTSAAAGAQEEANSKARSRSVGGA